MTGDQQAFMKGFLKSAREAGYTDSQISNVLQKAAGFADVAKSLLNSKTVNYGVPLATAAGTAGSLALGADQPWVPSIGLGLGAGLLASPGSWRNVINTARQAGNAGHTVDSFGADAVKLIARKSIPGTAAAGLYYVPDILKNISKSTGNLEGATSEIQKGMGPMLKNVQDSSAGVSGAARELGGVVSSLKNLTSSSVDPTTGQLVPAPLNSLASSADSASKAMSNIAGAVDKGIGNMPKYMLGGGLAAGGGYLGYKALDRYLSQHEEKKKEHHHRDVAQGATV